MLSDGVRDGGACADWRPMRLDHLGTVPLWLVVGGIVFCGAPAARRAWLAFLRDLRDFRN